MIVILGERGGWPRPAPGDRSLAGRTAEPLLTDRTRVGGFGGAEGLARFLTEHRASAVVDATHPFAATMHANAAAACTAAGVQLLRVERPSWAGHPDADRWRWVDSHADAGAAAASRAPVLLTAGRQHTPDYVDSSATSPW